MSESSLDFLRYATSAEEKEQKNERELVHLSKTTAVKKGNNLVLGIFLNI